MWKGVESSGLWWEDEAKPQQPGQEVAKDRNILTPSSLAGDPFWPNPRVPVDADWASQPPGHRAGQRRLGVYLEGRSSAQRGRTPPINGREKM